jgi:hypothetical protein
MARGQSTEARSLALDVGLDDPVSAELLVEGGPFADAMRALGDLSRASLLGWQAVAKRLRASADRARVLSEVAVAFAECSHPAEARRCLDDALDAARSAEPAATLDTLATCAIVTAHVDGADALWNAFESFRQMQEQAW